MDNSKQIEVLSSISRDEQDGRSFHCTADVVGDSQSECRDAGRICHRGRGNSALCGDGGDGVMRKARLVRVCVGRFSRNGSDLYGVNDNRMGGVWGRNEQSSDEKDESTVLQDIVKSACDVKEGGNRHSLEASDGRAVRDAIDVVNVCARSQEKEARNMEGKGRSAKNVGWEEVEEWLGSASTGWGRSRKVGKG